MKVLLDEYCDLLEKFIDHKIKAIELVDLYLNKFKEEDRHIPDPYFEILDEIFACIDSYTPDDGLIEENPEFYLSENQLRDRIMNSLKLLR